MIRVLALVGLGLVAAAPATAAPVLPVGGVLDSMFDFSSGIDDLSDHVDGMILSFEGYFRNAAQWLYVMLFMLQFLLIGATMVVRGPFALTSIRPVNALGPAANFFFFLIAGAFGYLLVDQSFYTVGVEAHGWVPWLYDLFREAGDATGCDMTDEPWFLLGLGDKCEPETLASVAMRISGAILAATEFTGSQSSNLLRSVGGALGPSAGVFGAFSVLAIQIALTQIAFKLAIVTAPLFLATLIFKPISGISTGYLNFVLYLGVKLAVLYLVAGLAAFAAEEWLTQMVLATVASIATGATGSTLARSVSETFSFHLSMLTISMLLLGLTIYLPARIASSVSGHFNLDLNALLFRGELPIQMD